VSKAVELLTEIRDLLSESSNPLMTGPQAAKFLRISLASLHAGENGGDIPAAVMTRGGPRWRREELIEWVRSLKPRKKKARRFKPRLVPVESAE
jgi:predicted DNA-binding transcriptional regulator AlpA